MSPVIVRWQAAHCTHDEEDDYRKDVIAGHGGRAKELTNKGDTPGAGARHCSAILYRPFGCTIYLNLIRGQPPVRTNERRAPRQIPLKKDSLCLLPRDQPHTALSRLVV